MHEIVLEGVEDFERELIPRIKIAPAGLDANALKMPVKWALLGLPVDIDVTA
jgi:hypothetical protein